MEKKDKIKLLSQLALIIGAISFFISILLLLNYWNTSKSDPLESEAMVALVNRLSSEPNNEALKLEIRHLDLLVRKAYFTSQWQVKTGGFLLLFSSIMLVLVLKVRYDMKKKIELPAIEEERGMMDRILSQRWIGIVGILIVAGALLASFTSNDYLGEYVSGGKQEVIPVTDPDIQVIDVASSGDAAKTQDSAEGDDESTTSEIISSNADEGSNQAVTAELTENTTKADPVKAGALSFPDLNEIKKNHNSFRGPLGQGISYHKNIPVDWDGASGKNVLWKIEVPKAGYNSPVIWGDKLFVSGADAQSRWIYCYNRNDGSLLWEHEAKGIEGSPAVAPKTSSDTGLAASSMTTDGKGVYAIFGTGDVIGLDMSGKRLWARNLGVPDNHYGHSSSLLTWAGKLIVQYDTNRSGRLLAMDVTDGKTLWDIPRDVKISWASPVLAEIGGKYQILTSSDPLAIGHDFETGKQLWSVECMMGEVGPSVGFADGLVYPSNEYARMVAIKPGAASAEIVWEADEYLPEASSPVVSKGLIFLGTSYGVFACFDAKTGEMYWEHEAGNGFYGSPMVADGRVYVVDMNGVAHIYEINKEFKLISEPQLGEKSVVTPAFAEGKIYLRGSKYLYCIGG